MLRGDSPVSDYDITNEISELRRTAASHETAIQALNDRLIEQKKTIKSLQIKLDLEDKAHLRRGVEVETGLAPPPSRHAQKPNFNKRRDTRHPLVCDTDLRRADQTNVTQSQNKNFSLFNLSTEEKIELVRVAAAVAGVYVEEPSVPPNLFLTKTIVLTLANFRYRTLVEAWDCRVASLGIRYVLWVLDLDLYHFLQDRRPDISMRVFFAPSIFAIHPSISSDGTAFRSVAFNVITCLKLFATRSLMELGYDVLLSDVDVFWFSDPFPWFGKLNQLAPSLQSCDIEYMQNAAWGKSGFFWRECITVGICPHDTEANSGFYFVKSSQATLVLFENAERSCTQRPDIDDQTNLWFNANPQCGWTRVAPAIKPPPNAQNIERQEANSQVRSSRGTPVVGVRGHGPALCPLPLLTHSVGTLFRDEGRKSGRGEWNTAKERAAMAGGYNNSEVIIGHFNMGLSFSKKEALFCSGLLALGLTCPLRNSTCRAANNTNTGRAAAENTIETNQNTVEEMKVVERLTTGEHQAKVRRETSEHLLTSQSFQPALPHHHRTKDPDSASKKSLPVPLSF
jgi:uncharacterized coiled-coil protein SlyX